MHIYIHTIHIILFLSVKFNLFSNSLLLWALFDSQNPALFQNSVSICTFSDYVFYKWKSLSLNNDILHSASFTVWKQYISIIYVK